jgi:hypothetical protein
LLVTGPLFLTDVLIGGIAGYVFVSADLECKEPGPRDELFRWTASADGMSAVESHHGMRLLVPRGKSLCLRSIQGTTKLIWAGFHP